MLRRISVERCLSLLKAHPYRATHISLNLTFDAAPPYPIAVCPTKPGQRFGFYNLRHGLATFLINKAQDTKTVQGLLRHANVSTTLGLYAQSVNTSMVEAQEAMLKAILRNGSNAVN